MNWEKNWAELVSQFEKSRVMVMEDSNRRSTKIPLRYFNQQAQLTVPASDYAMLEKAVNLGFAATQKILAKFQISNDELARAFGIQASQIQALLSEDTHAPMVMVDGEDAQALRDDVVSRGRKNAIRIFRDGNWGNTLRFYRPSGLALKYCVRDLVEVLSGAAEGRGSDQFPIDGVVVPKLDHPEQMLWIVTLLDRIERKLGLEPDRIKIQFLVESGWALMNVQRLAEIARARLTGIIFGIADYSAAVNLPEIVNNHPVCDIARSWIVNAASAFGVPAIDNMTVNYPVAQASLSGEQNRELILNRMRECFLDARHGENLGMDGKWVGHPLQLFTVLLAYRTARPSTELQEEVAKIEAYARAVNQEVGATMIHGVMSDRATDRQARQKLRKAVAKGLLPRERALELGIISREESGAA